MAAMSYRGNELSATQNGETGSFNSEGDHDAFAFCINSIVQNRHWIYYIHMYISLLSLQWRPDGQDGVSNHQPHDCLLNRLFRRRSKKTSKLRVTGLCEGNSPVTGEFPPQRASNAKNVSIWWRHHGASLCYGYTIRARAFGIHCISSKAQGPFY